MAELFGLLGRLGERLLTGLPALLIRWKYPPEAIAKRFFILLERPDSLQLTLAGAHSRFTLVLTALNLSPIWVEIERFDIAVSVANQPLYEGQILRTQRLDSFAAFPAIVYGYRSFGSSMLYFTQQLDSVRADAAAKYAASQRDGQYAVQLRVQVYGRCKTGRLERSDISFDIPPGAAGVHLNAPG